MDGKGHAKMATWTGAILGVTGIATSIAGYPEIGVGLTLGAFCGWLITPDADHNVLTEEERRWKGKPIIGPYMLETFAGYGAKHKHRGRSHWPLWGTVSRMWYFARRFLADATLLAYVVIVLILDGVMDGAVVDAVIPYLPGWPFFLSFFAGWAIQDFVHICTDIVWSWWRSERGRRQRGRVIAVTVILLISTVIFFVMG